MLELSKLEKLIELQIKMLPLIRTTGWLIRPVMYTNYKNINLTTNTILNYRISPMIITSESVSEIRHKQVAYRRIGIYVFTESTGFGVEQSRKYIPKSIKCQLLAEYKCFHFHGTMGAQVADVFFYWRPERCVLQSQRQVCLSLVLLSPGRQQPLYWLVDWPYLTFTQMRQTLWRGHKSYSKCVSH